MVSRLDVAVIVVTMVGAMLWIERGHRIAIEAPTLPELASPTPAAVCPDSDNVPYSASCLAFMGSTAAAKSVRGNGSDSAFAAPTHAVAACPDNDNVPYSAGCLAFLKGSTEAGMRWRARAVDTPVPTYAPR